MEPAKMAPKQKSSLIVAEELKTKGNNCFKLKDLKNALNYYEMCF